MPSSRGSSRPRDGTEVSHIAGGLYHLSHQGSPNTVTLDHKSFTDGLITKGKESRVKQVPLCSVQGNTTSRTLVAFYWPWEAKPQELSFSWKIRPQENCP